MDDTILNKINSCLNTVLDFNSTNEQRKEAEKYLQEIKNDPKSPIYGYYLALKNNNQNNEARHFGINMIIDAVSYKWNEKTYSDNERNELRQMALDLLKETGGILEEANYIKEKIVILIVEIAKRSWPNEWTNFDVILRTLYEKDRNTQQLVLLIYRNLAQEVYLDEISSIPELRKKQIASGLIAVSSSAKVLLNRYDYFQSHPENVTPEQVAEMELMVQMVRGDYTNEGWLVRWTNTLENYKKQYLMNKMTNNEMELQQLEQLIVNILDTLSSFIKWVIFESLNDIDILPKLTTMLVQEYSYKIKRATLECIYVLMSRNFHINNDERNKLIFNPLFDNNGLNNIFHFWVMLYEVSNFTNVTIQQLQQIQYSKNLIEDNYKLLLHVNDILTTLGVNHISNKKLSFIPNNLDNFFDLMMLLLNHPSIIISSSSLHFWIIAFQSMNLKEKGVLKKYIPLILERILNEFSKGKVFSDLIEEYYINIDFELKTDDNEISLMFEQRVINLIKLFTNYMPLEVYNWVTGKIIEIMNSSDPSSLDELGCYRNDSVYYKIYSATVKIYQIVASSISDDINKFNLVKDTMIQFYNFLINYSTFDPFISIKYIRMLSFFVILIKNSEETNYLLLLFEKLFSYVTYKLTADSTKYYEISKSIRQKAITSLTDMALIIPDIFMRYYNEICNTIMKISCNDDITYENLLSLKQLLIIICYHSNLKIEDKKKYIEEVFNTIMQEWIEESKNGEIYSSPEIYMEYIGVRELSEILKVYPMDKNLSELDNSIIEKLNGLKLRRTKVYLILNSVWVLIKKTIYIKNDTNEENKQIWNGYFEFILQSVLTIAKVSHSLWNKNNWTNILPNLRKELLNEINIKDSSITVKNKSVNTIYKYVKQLQGFITSEFEICYLIIGALTKLPIFYNYNNIGDILINELLFEAENLTNTQWKNLISTVITPLLSNCPEFKYNIILEKILPELIQYISKKLISEWENVEYNIDEDNDNDNEDDEFQEEIFYNKTLRDLTRSLVFLYSKLVEPQIPKGKKENLTREISPDTYKYISHYIFNSKSIIIPLLQSLSEIIMFKDSKSSNKSINILVRILPELVKKSELYEIIGCEILKTALMNNAYNDSYHQEMHVELIALITDIYLLLRPKCDIPFNTLSQLNDMTTAKIQAMENELFNSKTVKNQQYAIKNLLNDIKGVSISQLHKNKESYKKPFLSKEMLLRTGSKDILNNNEETGISNLFENYDE
ncbi:ARM repeat-containing protein [Anaeromyces robustus]|uniref:ARM repeat-containing protein n=1 Tax=Anaeromyces robustus TaxID=1754192 RepID=A0A1Y1XC52_9FUNG|nr:ARM repeat-containing protein [Anaeromyces robustus]|eukprot:ORX83318.1 ARM repeat-containing protein [Anaeromyces robustus]